MSSPTIVEIINQIDEKVKNMFKKINNVCKLNEYEYEKIINIINTSNDIDSLKKQLEDIEKKINNKPSDTYENILFSITVLGQQIDLLKSIIQYCKTYDDNDDMDDNNTIELTNPVNNTNKTNKVKTKYIKILKFKIDSEITALLKSATLKSATLKSDNEQNNYIVFKKLLDTIDTNYDLENIINDKFKQKLQTKYNFIDNLKNDKNLEQNFYKILPIIRENINKNPNQKLFDITFLNKLMKKINEPEPAKEKKEPETATAKEIAKESEIDESTDKRRDLKDIENIINPLNNLMRELLLKNYDGEEKNRRFNIIKISKILTNLNELIKKYNSENHPNYNEQLINEKSLFEYLSHLFSINNNKKINEIQNKYQYIHNNSLSPTPISYLFENVIKNDKDYINYINSVSKQNNKIIQIKVEQKIPENTNTDTENTDTDTENTYTVNKEEGWRSAKLVQSGGKQIKQSKKRFKYSTKYNKKYSKNKTIKKRR